MVGFLAVNGFGGTVGAPVCTVGIALGTVGTLLGVVGTLLGTVGTLLGVVDTLLGTVGTLLGTVGTLLGVVGTSVGTTGVVAGMARLDASNLDATVVSFLCGAESDLERLDRGDGGQSSTDVSKSKDPPACFISEWAVTSAVTASAVPDFGRVAAFFLPLKLEHEEEPSSCWSSRVGNVLTTIGTVSEMVLVDF